MLSHSANLHIMCCVKHGKAHSNTCIIMFFLKIVINFKSINNKSGCGKTVILYRHFLACHFLMSFPNLL